VRAADPTRDRCRETYANHADFLAEQLSKLNFDWIGRATPRNRAGRLHFHRDITIENGHLTEEKNLRRLPFMSHN
jgi:hypothetical protein